MADKGAKNTRRYRLVSASNSRDWLIKLGLTKVKSNLINTYITIANNVSIKREPPAASREVDDSAAIGVVYLLAAIYIPFQFGQLKPSLNVDRSN